ncbi:MAG: hypothetical protein ACI87E_003114 [Mariniblastus sp.]|jgi:hypothetical protein
MECRQIISNLASEHSSDSCKTVKPSLSTFYRRNGMIIQAQMQGSDKIVALPVNFGGFAPIDSVYRTLRRVRFEHGRGGFRQYDNLVSVDLLNEVDRRSGGFARW